MKSNIEHPQVNQAPTLPAPSLPVIDLLNLPGLGHSHLADPQGKVAVTAKPSETQQRAGDHVELFWDGQSVHNFTLREEHIRNDSIVFSVPPSAINEPRGELYYTALAPQSGVESVSAVRTVLVKISVPGNPDPNPDTPYLNENLLALEGLPEQINEDQASRGLSLTIPAWANMHEGDVLTLFWDGTRKHFVQPPLTSTQVGKPQQVFIDSATLMASAAGTLLEVSYEIRDSVLNWSLYSLPAWTELDTGAAALPAPRILDADNNGVIDLDQLGDRDVEVQLPNYSGMALNDEVTLKWLGQTADGLPVERSVVRILDADDLDFSPILVVPGEAVQAIAGGSAAVYYTVQHAAGGGLLSSRRASVTVRGTVQTLPLPRVVEAVNGVLDPVTVPPAGVTVIVPAYPAMDSGQQIYLVWEGLTQSGAPMPYYANKPVTGNNVGTDIAFVVPKVLAEALAGGSLKVSYQVETFGRMRLESPVLALSVAGGEQMLPAPSVDHVVNGILDPTSAPAGTLARIPDYPSKGTGETVTLHWVGKPGDGTVTDSVIVRDPAQQLSFDISLATLMANLPGDVEVWYAVSNGSQPARLSMTLNLRVQSTLAVPQLIAPTVDGLMNGVLDPATIEDHAIVRADYNQELTTDLVTLIWQDATGGQLELGPVNPPTQGAPLIFLVPKSQVLANAGQPVSVSYTVKRGGLVYVSPPLAMQIKDSTPALVIDTSQMQLDGHIYRFAHHETEPKQWPAGTAQTRVAQNGTPPYTYTSSDPTVAKVEPSGQVTSRKNGAATITVTDSAEQYLTYPVVVSNVQQCMDLGLANYAGIEQLAGQYGATVGSLEVLRELYAMYGSSYPLRSGKTWSSSKSGIKHYLKDMTNGQEWLQVDSQASIHAGMGVLR